MTDFASVASWALARAHELVPAWLPGGKRRGHEWVCGDITGKPGDSLSVNLSTGLWADFAGEIQGGDLIALYAAIHGMSQLEAREALDPGADAPETLLGPPKRDTVVPQRPPDANFPTHKFRHHVNGEPSAIWVYRDAEGPLFVVARYDLPEGKKEVRPWIWDGLKWQNRAFTKPRPLYGLDRLAKSTAPVLLVEGEKAADAGQRLFPGRPVMTWPGGSKAIGTVHWEPLRGREVTIWPDADEPGKVAGALVAQILIKLDCNVRVINPDPDKPAGWDLADAEIEGLSPKALVAYAKERMKDTVKPAPAPSPVVEVIREAPPPGTQTLIHNPPRGSRVELWQRVFITKTNGSPVLSQSNVQRAIDHRGDLGIYFDAFTNRVMTAHGEWDDAKLGALLTYLQEELGFAEMSETITQSGVVNYAYSHKRNSAQDWMNSLPPWDDTKRLADLMPVGFGAKRNSYTEAVGRCFMVSMVARVMQPGCKVDHMPVFEGRQGVGKSTALSKLGDEWFSEIHDPVTTKDFFMSIAGKILCEISELSSFNKAEISRIKGIISNPVDRYRPPYGRTPRDHPRSCVFSGTTNRDDWNHDDTGARRFWPIRCVSVSADWIEDNRTQLFAEALHRYTFGERWWDVDEADALLQQEARRSLDPWADPIRNYSERKEFIHVSDILTYCLDMKLQDQTQQDATRVRAVLRDLKFVSKLKREEDGKVLRCWYRPKP